MKLPPQIAAVVREGHSWPSRRSSADGVSASFGGDIRHFRRDINVCAGDSANWKCNFNQGQNYQVCKCPNGTCQCCQCGCAIGSGGNCVCKPC
jgi:hypothetical protein